MVRITATPETTKKTATLMAAVLIIALLLSSCDSNIKEELIEAGSAPSAPGTLTITPGNGQLTVSWSAVSGADSYDVYSYTDNDSPAAELFENTTGTTSTVTGLTNGILRYVWVKAKNTAGSSGFSQVGQGIPVDSAVTAPSTPGTLTVTPGNTQLTVSWSAIDGATSYDVYSSATNDSSGAVLFGNTTGTTSTVTGLMNGTLRYVWVKAKNSGGSSGFSLVGSGTPVGGSGTTFIEQNLVSTSSEMVGSSYTDVYNAGVGQQITLSKSYTPTSFSVFVHSTKYFKHIILDSSLAAAVDLSLSIRNQNNNTEIAAATAHINARTISGEEEVVFTISGAPTITSGTPVLYAVYLPASLASDVRGELLFYSSGTNQYLNGVYWKSNQADDTTITNFVTKWNVSVTNTYDLKFKLVATEQ